MRIDPVGAKLKCQLRIAEESESIAEENESPLSLYFTTFCAEFWGGALRFGALGPAELDIRPPGRRSEPEWGWSSSRSTCDAVPSTGDACNPWWISLSGIFSSVRCWVESA
jgi:hypothetical protein